MNHFAINQGSFAAAAGRSAEKRDTVVCPKPRRIGLRWHTSSYQQEDCDSKAGNELLEIILARRGPEDSVPWVASSPPFFSGSPPGRVSNPLIRDVRFGEEGVSGVASPRNGGCVRASFGNNPTVRVEGFDCRIPTLA